MFHLRHPFTGIRSGPHASGEPLGRTSLALLSKRVSRVHVLLTAVAPGERFVMHVVGRNAVCVSTAEDVNVVRPGQWCVVGAGDRVRLCASDPATEFVFEPTAVPTNPTTATTSGEKQADEASSNPPTPTKRARVEPPAVEEAAVVRICPHGAQCVDMSASHNAGFVHAGHAQWRCPAAPTAVLEARALPRVPLVLEWVTRGGLACCQPRNGPPLPAGSVVVAAFDLDATLLAWGHPRGGINAHGVAADARLQYPCVASRVAQLHRGGHVVAVLSNQGWQGSSEEIARRRFELLHELLGGQIPFYGFAALQWDHHRKPSVGMWQALVAQLGRAVDMAQSFFVGDAAGRPQDHSCTDRQFAANAGLRFLTPEEFFLHQPVSPNWSWGASFDVRAWLASCPLAPPPQLPRPGKTLEVVLCCGFPASGKSTYCLAHFASHVYVNADQLKSTAACHSAVGAALQQRRSVVVDNCNLGRSTRRPYVELASQYGVSVVRVLRFTAPVELCKHLNALRHRCHLGRAVPNAAYTRLVPTLEEPSLDEGLSSIEVVPFVPAFRDGQVAAEFLLWAEPCK